ncbi:MAG: ABC transporter permease [Chloroflexota bacterium]
MTIIAAVALALTAAILLFVGLIAVRNPVMFKMGLRNIPRRKAQTTLIVIGLMLSTLIMTAAFGTGDTLTTSITAEVYDVLGEADEEIRYNEEDFPAPEDEQVIPLAQVQAWREQFRDDPQIAGFLPMQEEVLPVANTEPRLNESAARIVGFRSEDARPFGGLKDTRGRQVALSGNQIAVNESLAGDIDAEVGDTLIVFFGNSQLPVTVVAIVPDTLLGGGFNLYGGNKHGGAVDLAFLASVTGKPDSADVVFITNAGGVRDGVKLSDDVMAKLDATLEGTRFEADDTKQSNLAFAQLFGNFFTTFFVIFGLFSIAAGVLLIFLIFSMLAAERKPEMGMARAVGAKRRQIVESFLAEGMGYDLGSAVVGLLAGIGVTVLMVSFIKWAIGDEIGDLLQVHFTLRSLVVSFCIGVIATFIVIFFASWRASRINIVAAIRDLPESKPRNPESATAMGYLRGVLNGFAAFGVIFLSLVAGFRLSPIFFLGMAAGFVGPFVYVLRSHNFAAPRAERKTGERIPLWPFFTVVGTVFYPVALLLTALTRDRRPARMPMWLIVAGIVIAPLGLVLVALQDRARSIAWSVGFGTVGGVVGALLVQWGLDANQMFFFAAGVSLLALWVAVTLRYFQIAERASFTLTSAVLLAFWYLAPANKLEWLTGELNGDFEMFFLSGMVMVTAGTFIVVYNADVFLPVVGAFGERFGRIVPAVKTAVAYPLASRFRTGMTVAMISLIMFSLIMFTTMNNNFVRIFLNDDAKGGFDVMVDVNGNNRVDDLPAALAAAGVDTRPLVTIAEARRAFPFETEVQSPVPGKNDDGTPDLFATAGFIGADDAFLRTVAFELDTRAAGYDSDRTAWEALIADHSLAIVPTSAFGFEGEFGEGNSDFLDLGDAPEPGFQPFEMTLRDPGTGKLTTVTVIGVTEGVADTFFGGVFVHRDTLRAAFPEARGQSYFLKLAPGTDAEAYAQKVEAALVQASADSLGALLDEERSQTAGFLYLFQGFMGLGLLVGIAALGVIAFRAVVERRQQIGMLRAIGYQRSMIALSFIFESAFIALSSIVLGLVLAVSLSWVLFTSGGIDESADDVKFIVPWLQIGVICAIAFGASLLMTFIPARSASRIAVAEALRYE